MATVTDEIRESPDRFVKGIDLSKVYDNNSFNKEVDRVRFDMRTEKQKRAYFLWENKREVLLKTPYMQGVLKNNIRGSSVSLRKSKRSVKGLQIDENTYLRFISYKRNNKTIEQVQRVDLRTGRVVKQRK